MKNNQLICVTNLCSTFWKEFFLVFVCVKSQQPLEHSSKMEATETKPIADSQTIIKLGEVLGNKSLPMPQRFRTIFTLKNIGGKEAIDALMLGKETILQTKLYRPQ